jgi:hypothetical protein
MLAATFLAVFFVPVFYVFMQRISEFRRKPTGEQAPTDATPEPQVVLQRVERNSPAHLALNPTHA